MYGLVFLLVVAAAFGGGHGFEQTQLREGTVADRVKVSVYFESLCSDSMKFFKSQLYPVWQDLQDIIDLEFIPFGKARATPTETGDYEFECQHGPDECYGNRVMSCAQNSLPIGTQVEFFQCMMTKRYPAFFGKQCSEEIGIAWAPLQECAESPKGAAMLYQNGIRTASLKPRVHFIPTITINGRYDNRQLRVSLMALRSQICASYDGPPHQNCL
ncbi:gamma-interferon-inducible lysosomal thiol reductase-like [Penaeus chinensis]|uniref:gamma-interferon-inducible lysosomal thiol reductase-like n=1 Tax=Penaeus chinensis TaxID=139456 RepID=UPI001FB815E2|nr:gamma-interferon-inducible lysosomal thiol reductase-like [Penaeus chinensis]